MRPSLVSLSRSYLNLIPALKYITKTLQNDDEGYEPSDSGFGFDDDDSASYRTKYQEFQENFQH